MFYPFKEPIMRNIICCILGIILIASCGLGSSNKPESRSMRYNSDTLVKFKQFLEKFKPLKLPYYANTSCYEPDSNMSMHLDPVNDSLFVKHCEMGISVGLFPDTSTFYALIYGGAAACYLPILAVYSKDGRQICEEQIANGCGCGPGYTCHDSIAIKSMTDITQIFNQEMVDLDSLGKEIESTRQKTFDVNKFYIDESGKINKKTTHKIIKK